MALDTTIGGTLADSYVTLAEYTAYAEAMGWTLADTDEENEVDLRRGALGVDRGKSFKGYRAIRTQAREFPRVCIGVVDGWEVSSATIPQAVKDAQCEMAHLIREGLDPFETVSGIISVERVKAGPVETEEEYLGGKGRPRIVAVDSLLRPYMLAGAGQVAMVRG